MLSEKAITARAEALLEKWETQELEEYARSFTAGKRRELAKKGHALPDGSFPIENTGDLSNALKLARSGHGNVSAAMAHIKKRAKALGVKLKGGKE